MATSSAKKTPTAEGAAAAPKKPRATKSAVDKEASAKKTSTKTKSAAAAAEPAPAATIAQTPAPVPAPVPTEPVNAVADSEAPIDESKVIQMKPPIQVRDLATRLNLKPFQLIHELMEMNVFATLNQTLEEPVAK
ncbi:MAG: translation initiation factor IF-2 N-terminal domain-containing protein, partial [Candidatus Methylacidiphilales bacterium]